MVSGYRDAGYNIVSQIGADTGDIDVSIGGD